MRLGTLALWTSLPVTVAVGSMAAPAETAEARLSCPAVPGPGRVLCELEVEVAAGRLAWADLLVVRSPELARPLRARVGPSDGAGRSARRMRLPLALGATEAGKGEITVLARWVRCRPVGGGAELCSAGSRRVSTIVQVGALEREAR